jgi:chorismate mutase / prephenate dehydratase
MRGNLTEIEEMTEPAGSERELEDIRNEIDAIDDELANLLERRFAATEHVRLVKSRNGALGGSPFRPAREATILRRLIGRPQGIVPADLLVRLWRQILTTSTQNQAAVSIHISKRLNSALGLRLRIRDYFGTMPVEEYRDETQALLQINENPGDICVVETDSPWVEAFLEGKAGNARIIACLPFIRDEPIPKLLVFGHSPSEPTGEDETLLVSDGKLPRDLTPTPLWQVKIGTRRVSSLPGFLSEHESPLVGVNRSNSLLGLRIAGRYPSPIELKNER